MMKRSVDEKYEYNRKQKTPFSYGYCMGVNSYRHYADAVYWRARVMDDVDYYKKLAVSGDKEKAGTKFAKGYMCGVRDTAAEHKNKRRR